MLAAEEPLPLCLAPGGGLCLTLVSKCVDHTSLFCILSTRYFKFQDLGRGMEGLLLSFLRL